MRRKVKNRNIVGGDKKYNSPAIAKFINYIMWDGKKELAERIVYGALSGAAAIVGAPELEVFNKVIENVSPAMEVRSRRIGGSNYQVPREVRPERRVQLAARWLIGESRAKKGKPMQEKLQEEFVLGFKGEGAAVKKKEEVLRMADANRAFAHFTW